MIFDQTIRIHKRELDLGECVEVYNDFFIDIIFESVNEEEADDYSLLTKIRKQDKMVNQKDSVFSIIESGKDNIEKIKENKQNEFETNPNNKESLSSELDEKKEDFAINDDTGADENEIEGIYAECDDQIDLGSPTDINENSNLEDEEKKKIDAMLDLDGDGSEEEGSEYESDEEDMDDYLENLEKNA